MVPYDACLPTQRATSQVDPRKTQQKGITQPGSNGPLRRLSPNSASHFAGRPTKNPTKRNHPARKQWSPTPPVSQLSEPLRRSTHEKPNKKESPSQEAMVPYAACLPTQRATSQVDPR